GTSLPPTQPTGLEPQSPIFRWPVGSSSPWRSRDAQIGRKRIWNDTETELRKKLLELRGIDPDEFLLNLLLILRTGGLIGHLTIFGPKWTHKEKERKG
ncbi:hypothetical protein SDJN02_07201, partial [Cucurbita argyrosperma subsp. argyrosperma]